MAAVQSRRFQSIVNPQAMFPLCKMLETNNFVSFYKWSDKEIYIEVTTKKTIAYFRNAYPALELVKAVQICSFPDDDIKGLHGTAMDTRQVSKDAKPKTEKNDTPEKKKLKEIYMKIRQEKVYPNLKDDVDAMLNRKDYDTVINNGISTNFHEDFDLNLRPWQKKALQAVRDQKDREVLWIFDFDGDTGKSEFLKYLVFKEGFQKLNAGSSHHGAGPANPQAFGFAFDFTRVPDGFLPTFNLIEDLKNKFLASNKFSGCEKIMAHNKVVVIANILPNMRCLSLDRWSFFHTKLGKVFFHCKPMRGGKEYVCVLSRKNKCDVKNFRVQCTSEISDSELYADYLNVYNFDFNYKLLVENELAFPNVTDDMRETIKNYILTGNHNSLFDFIKQKKCFKNSIVPKNFKFQFHQLEDTDSTDSDSE